MLAGNFWAPTCQEYVFVHAPALPEADAELTRIAGALPAEARVAVIGDDYWPLPWYFRARREYTEYFSEDNAPALEEALEKYALVIYAGYQLDARVTGAGWRLLDLRPGYYVSLRARAKEEGRMGGGKEGRRDGEKEGRMEGGTEGTGGGRQ